MLKRQAEALGYLDARETRGDPTLKRQATSLGLPRSKDGFIRGVKKDRIHKDWIHKDRIHKDRIHKDWIHWRRSVDAHGSESCLGRWAVWHI